MTRDERSGWIELSLTEFVLLWRVGELGEPPNPLELPHLARTDGQFDELVREGSRTLAARDLGTVAEPAGDVAGMLAALSQYDMAVDLLVARREVPIQAVGVTGPKGAVVAATDGEYVRIGPTHPSGLVRALLELLDRLPAPEGRPANVPIADYRRACAEGEAGGGDRFLAVLREAGVRTPEARTVLRAVTQRFGGGQLGAAVQDRHGAAHRLPSPLSWVDTADGRYSLRVRDGWLTVTPVDLPRLATMAEEFLAAVPAARA